MKVYPSYIWHLKQNGTVRVWFGAESLKIVSVIRSPIILVITMTNGAQVFFHVSDGNLDEYKYSPPQEMTKKREREELLAKADAEIADLGTRIAEAIAKRARMLS